METITKSPTKRRALAALDANALPSPKPHQLKNTTTSPLKERKRPLEPMAALSPLPQKRACFEVAEDDRSRSQSPDTSSIFDTSANDSSWATEPEASPAPRVMTREQAREKAEILRLRLGLASYKFRTGQTSVPLANLQRMPLPPRASSMAGAAKKPETTSTAAKCQPEKKKMTTISAWGAGDSVRPQARAWGRVSYSQREKQRLDHEDDSSDNDEDEGRDDEDQAGEDAAPELPRLSPSKYAISALQGAGESVLTDRVLSGGAADGLLSLSRSNSDV